MAFVIAVALATAACAPTLDRPGATAGVRMAPAPPNPARNTAARADPADRARFECAVTVQRAQNFDPGRSLVKGSIIGAVAGGAAGGSLGALFGLIGDVPGDGAAVGATVLGAIGIVAGGLISLDRDTGAYERGVAACLGARAAAEAPAAAAPGLVEYRLRVLNVRHEAFTAFLGIPELGEGAPAPGLARLAETADRGVLQHGAVLLDRHVVPLSDPAARAFGATPTAGLVKLGGARRDYWDEARWYGTPGERSVWMITSRNRRPQEVRRVGLSEATAFVHHRPLRQPLFAPRPEATVAVSLPYLLAAEQQGRAGAWVDRTLDLGRGLTAIVGTTDDVFPDRVYLVVTQAESAATYEAVLAWSERDEMRDRARGR